MNKRRAILGFIVASTCIIESQAQAQAIRLPNVDARRYARLSGSERAWADRAFYLMIYDRSHDLKRALASATTISGFKARDPTKYNERFRSDWIKAYLPAAYAGPMPPVPSNPSSLSDNDPWGYPKYLKIVAKRDFETTESRNSENADFLSKLGAIIAGKGPGTVLKFSQMYFSKSGKALPGLFDPAEIREMYQVAINAAQSGRSDSVLKNVADGIILENYGNKVTDLQAVGDPRPNRPPLQSKESDDALIARVEGAVSRVLEATKQDLRASSADDHEPSAVPQDGPGSPKYELDEAQGLTQIAIAILQFNNPQAAQHLNLVTTATFKAITLFNAYNAGETGNGPKMGSLSLAGGFVGIITSIMSAQADADEKAALFAQLQGLALAIDSVREIMQTGFRNTDEKLNLLIGFQVSQAADTTVAVEAIKRLSIEIASSILAVDGTSERARALGALRSYREQKTRSLDAVASDCAFLSQPVAEPAKEKCVRNILVALLTDAKKATLAADEAFATDDHAVLLAEGALGAGDLLLGDILTDLGPVPPERDITFGASSERVPGGLPDLNLFISLMTELRRRVELDQFPLNASHLDALRAVIDDGNALSEALGGIDKDYVETSWFDYIRSLKFLNIQVQHVLSESSRYTTVSGLPYDAKYFCFSCPDIPVQGRIATIPDNIKNFPDNTAAYLLSLTPPEKAEPWWTRAWMFDLVDDVYKSRMADSSAQARVGRIMGESTTYVEYSSLPSEFRKKLGLQNVEYLHKASALRLYLRVTSVSMVVPKFISGNDGIGECGPIQPAIDGGKCWTKGRVAATWELVALTRPIVEPDEFVKSSAEAGRIVSADALKGQWASFGADSVTFTLYTGSLDISAPMPLSPVGGIQIQTHAPSWQDVLAYIYVALRDTPQISAGKDLQVVNSTILEGEKRRTESLMDAYRAVKGAGEGRSAIVPHVVLSDIQARSIHSASRQAEIDFRRWLFVSGLAVGDAALPQTERCAIDPEAILAFEDERYRYFFDENTPIIISDPGRSKCESSAPLQVTPAELKGVVDGWVLWAKSQVTSPEVRRVSLEN